MVTVENVRAARRIIARAALRTPIVPARFADGVLFKCENLQRGGSFKIRGAFFNAASLPPAVRRRGVVAYSSGNHAQGVALAARMLKVPAWICMLDSSLPEKVEQTRAYGAEAILAGKTSEEIKRRAEEIAQERGATLVPPFDHPKTIAGQGTIGLEIVEDVPDLRTVVVPIGGGGLISGIAIAVKSLKRRVRIVGVEPRTADKMAQAVAAGKPVTIAPSLTVADGLKPIRCGDLTFEIVRALVDELVQVEDHEILAATAHLIRREKLVVEPSGAASFAAVLSGKVRPTGTAVCVLSGGNIDPALFGRLFSSGP